MKPKEQILSIEGKTVKVTSFDDEATDVRLKVFEIIDPYTRTRMPGTSAMAKFYSRKTDQEMKT